MDICDFFSKPKCELGKLVSTLLLLSKKEKRRANPSKNRGNKIIKKMHGRPRKAPKPEDEAASAAKVQKLRALQTQFFTYHHNKMYPFLFFSFLIILFNTFSDLTCVNLFFFFNFW